MTSPASSSGISLTEERRRDELRKQLNSPELSRQILPSGGLAPCSDARALALLEFARSFESQWHSDGGALAESLEAMYEVLTPDSDSDSPVDRQIFVEIGVLYLGAREVLFNCTFHVLRQTIDWLESALVLTSCRDPELVREHERHSQLTVLLRWTRSIAEGKRRDELRQQLYDPELANESPLEGGVPCDEARAFTLLELAKSLEPGWHTHGAALAESREALFEIGLLSSGHDLDIQVHLEATELFHKSEEVLRCSPLDKLHQASAYLESTLDLASLCDPGFTPDNGDARNLLLLEHIRYITCRTCHHESRELFDDARTVVADSLPEVIVSQGSQQSQMTPTETSSLRFSSLYERRLDEPRKIEGIREGSGRSGSQELARSVGFVRIDDPVVPKCHDDAALSCNTLSEPTMCSLSSYEEVRLQAEAITDKISEIFRGSALDRLGRGARYLRRALSYYDSHDRLRIFGLMQGLMHAGRAAREHGSWSFSAAFSSSDTMPSDDDWIDECMFLLNRIRDYEGESGPAERLINTGTFLLQCFAEQNDISRLHSAIICLLKAVEMFPPEHLRWRAHLILGKALCTRFKTIGVPSDAYAAIEHLQFTIGEETCDIAVVSKALSEALSYRHVLEKKHVDIEVAVELERFVASQTGDRVVLAKLLLARYTDSGNHCDIEESILHLKQMLGLYDSQIAAGNISQPVYVASRTNALYHLGCAHRTRYFNLSYDNGDVVEAISAFTTAIDTLSADTEGFACREIMVMLRSALAAILTIEGVPSLLRSRGFADAVDMGIDNYRQVSLDVSAQPSFRFNAALGWGRCEYDRSNFEEALNGYTTAIKLLPSLGWNGDSSETREESCARMGLLGCYAPSCAIRSGLYERAIELSEHVRSMFWTGMLPYNLETVELEKSHPKLAERLQIVQNNLQRDLLLNFFPQFDSKIVSGAWLPEKLDATTESHARKRRKLLKEWEECLEELHGLPDHEEYLRQTSYSTLQMAATCGPVIVLIPGSPHSDALIIKLNEPITHVPLEISIDETSRIAIQLQEEVRGPDKRNEVLRDILQRLWAVCSPILQSLDTDHNKNQHVWWCPTGPFAFLPIHAAGKYRTNGRPVNNQTMPSRVVSSYTTSVGELARGIAQTCGASSPQKSPKLMFVGTERETLYGDRLGAGPLPSVRKEMEAIAELFPPDRLTCLLDDTRDASASVKAVLHELIHGSHDFIHFACHGHQFSFYPILNCLLLNDGPLTLSHLLGHSMLGDKASSFTSTIFLSACETAPGPSIMDQAVHLAAGMQHVGFNSVVATLWPILDEFAPEVAKHFYAQVSGEDESDSDYPCGRDTGKALQDAIQIARDSDPTNLWGWVPYIHVGV